MAIKKYIDVDPKDWYYRVITEAQNIFLDPKKEETLFSDVLHNKFIKGKSRGVFNFTSKEGQTQFKIKNYKPDSRERVIVYVDGVPYPPSKLAKGVVTIGAPLSGGHEVCIAITGVVSMHEGDETTKGCGTYPLTNTCTLSYPVKKLSKQSKYVFDTRYSLNEVCVCMGKKLKRVNVKVGNGESKNNALRKAIGNKNDCFTIIDGYLYVSYNLNNFPMQVNYNYKRGAVIKNLQKEKVVPTSKCVMYNDRFFPDATLTRAQFFSLLQRMRRSLYNKFTDRTYVPNLADNTDRYIKDRSKIIGKWYDEDVLNILDEKFNDGCYVFPLYEDDTFQPEVCVTRAEAVVYLNRFTEWALERFR